MNVPSGCGGDGVMASLQENGSLNQKPRAANSLPRTPRRRLVPCMPGPAQWIWLLQPGPLTLLPAPTIADRLGPTMVCCAQALPGRRTENRTSGRSDGILMDTPAREDRVTATTCCGRRAPRTLSATPQSAWRRTILAGAIEIARAA